MPARSGKRVRVGEGELRARLVEVARAPGGIGQVQVQRPELLGMRSRQRDDPTQLRGR